MGEEELDGMTREEMQRFLIMEAVDGRSKEEVLDRLLEVLGIAWPGSEGR